MFRPLMFSLVALAYMIAGRALPAQEAIAPDVLQKIKRAAVFVKVGGAGAESSGSGFVIHRDGETALLVTNAHVVNADSNPALPRPFIPRRFRPVDAEGTNDGGASIQVVFHSGTPKEEAVKAQVVAQDATKDLAILKATGVKSEAEPIPLDPKFQPAETTPVFTFGFPFGAALSRTKGNPAITVGRGAVSSLRLDDKGEPTAVQIDGALNTGNSGGPVVDAKGRLVGVAVATIRGSGIGFAIPSSELEKLMAGRIARIRIYRKRADDEGTLDLEFTLFDPHQKIRTVAAYCSPTEAKAVVPPPQKPIEGGQKVTLELKDGVARGQWTLPAEAARSDVVSIQPVLVDQDGKEHFSAAMQHRRRSAEPTEVAPLGSPRPRVAQLDGKVFSGVSRKVGDTALTGGVLIIRNGKPAVGLGLADEGEKPSAFSYFVVVKLPAGNFSRTSFVSRDDTKGAERRLSFGVYLDNTELTIDQSFAAGKDAIDGEKLHFFDRAFDPAEGRLFLIDLSGNEPKVVQKKVAIPAAPKADARDDAALVELADKTLDGLIESNAEVREFIGAKKP